MTNGCIPLALSFLLCPGHNRIIPVDLPSSINLINIIHHQPSQRLNNSSMYAMGFVSLVTPNPVKVTNTDHDSLSLIN